MTVAAFLLFFLSVVALCEFAFQALDRKKPERHYALLLCSAIFFTAAWILADF